MTANRVFIPQDALQQWLDEGRVALDGEIMTLQPEGQQFVLKSAVRFLSELGGGGDAQQLVGKVKDLQQLGQLEGEHCADSVLIGDDAYQVVEGFVGAPITPASGAAQPETLAEGDSLTEATRAAVGEESQRDSLDPLTRFLMQKR